MDLCCAAMSSRGAGRDRSEANVQCGCFDAHLLVPVAGEMAETLSVAHWERSVKHLGVNKVN